MEKIECTISSCLDELHCADSLTEKVAGILHLDEDRKNNLAIAVTEAVGNAIIHGNHKDPEKKVIIRICYSSKEISVSIQDEGRGFDPENLDDPLLPENLMKESGRGIFILKELMDDVHFEFTKNGTILHMVMKLDS